MAANVKGKVALVSGGGRGIGRAIALALGRAGAHVVVAARSGDEIAAVAKEITAAGGAASAIAVDLADESSVVNLFTQVVDRLGRLDVLVNNAGVGRYARVAELSAADVDAMMAVNIRGTALCCREAMKLMIPHRSGYIINISSVLGFKGYANQGAYTATKHAVMGLTRSLAVEAQEHGIRVSVISPGGVDTEMVRRSRPDLDPSILLSPEDIAQAVLYLLSLSDRAAVDEIYIRRRTSAPF
ncbi:MAG: SDR family oxidoreductase [Planctomycetaceae bacterium]|nr:SDR family oxidoreductase [Planctomycetaceae bacterium]